MKFFKKKTVKNKKETEQKQKNKKINETKKFKEKYFDFYDDVKHYTRGREDW